MLAWVSTIISIIPLWPSVPLACPSVAHCSLIFVIWLIRAASSAALKPSALVASPAGSATPPPVPEPVPSVPEPVPSVSEPVPPVPEPVPSVPEPSPPVDVSQNLSRLGNFSQNLSHLGNFCQNLSQSGILSRKEWSPSPPTAR